MIYVALGLLLASTLATLVLALSVHARAAGAEEAALRAATTARLAEGHANVAVDAVKPYANAVFELTLAAEKAKVIPGLERELLRLTSRVAALEAAAGQPKEGRSDA